MDIAGVAQKRRVEIKKQFSPLPLCESAKP